jgi:hypothetical protein
MKMKIKQFLGALIICIVSLSCSESTTELVSEDFTEIEVVNNSAQDSVKVFLTLQAPHSVIGKFGIKESDTIGSVSQGYFYAHRNKSYFLNSPEQLFGWNISFESAPIACNEAINQGFLSGVNIVEGSINCEYEVFDISCVDGVNAKIQTKVTDSNWTTGYDPFLQKFDSTENSIELAENCNKRGVFPYRCSNCVDTSKTDVPKNCFNLPLDCSSKNTCQVARTNQKGGTIIIVYKGK